MTEPVIWSPVLVTPAVAVVSSSVANPTVLTTLTPHGLATGDTVTVAGHTGSTPAVAGALAATVLTPTTLSVPVNVSVGGTGGTVTRTAAAPVIALADAKLHARIPADVTTEDAYVANLVKAATIQVENDTSVKMLPQTYDLRGSAFPSRNGPIVLPFGPLLSVSAIQSTDAAAVLNTMTAADYVSDTSSQPGRIGLADAANWPTDLRLFDPIVVRVIVGHASVSEIPEPLRLAMLLLFGHWYAVREAVNVGNIIAPYDLAYETLIRPYRAVCVA